MKRLTWTLCALLALGACATPGAKPAAAPHGKSLTQAERKKVQSYYIEGVYAYAEGNTEKAMASWKRALAIDPHHAETLKAMQEAKQKQEAVKKLNN